jgi:trans-aconitate methyltransferase
MRTLLSDERLLPMQTLDWLERYQPQVPIENLVEEINVIFHSFDAAQYDREHAEIHQQLPPIWGEMIAELPHAGPWRVFNLGCGTGFEANLLLSRLGDKVAKLIAYDRSPEMVDICRMRLHKYSQAASFARIDEALGQGPFNLVITNSLLHHLPNIVETMGMLLPVLDSNAVWLAGHEPSTRFYGNADCLKLLEEYRHYRRYAKWFELGNYATKLRQYVTARRAHKRGLFSKRPDVRTIGRIIDFHVAHSLQEVAEGRGLGIDTMQSLFQRDWILRWSKTYSFLGPFKYAGVPDKWVKRALLLEKKFPGDGANFCTAWYRKAGPVDILAD